MKRNTITRLCSLAAADVQALQVAGGHAVTDEMKFKGFHA